MSTWNVMAVNPGHNGAVALVVDGILRVYIEEERLSRQKYDGNPYRGMIDILQRYPIDELIIGGTTPNSHNIPWTREDSNVALVRKFYPNVRVIDLAHEHHLGHAAAAFYGSGFDSAVAVVVDGCGSIQRFGVQEQQHAQGGEGEGYETESIYQCGWPGNIEPVLKRMGANYGPTFSTTEDGVTFDMDASITTVKAYEAVSEYLGFGFIEAGKTMGLAPYGKEDSSIPDLLMPDTNRGNRNVFNPIYPAGAIIDQSRVPYLRQTANPKEWHNDSSKLPDVARNLAWKIQQQTQKYVGDLIERAVDTTGEDNVVLSGGYALNVMANYYYKERFPDVNLYVDPISHDGGTVIGLAKLFAHKHISEINERNSKVVELKDNSEIPHIKDPLTTLYLGFPTQVTEEQLSKLPDVKITDTTPTEVAQLIKDKNIVSIFQGRSEAGPRALGNRSILYDPTDPNGKDFVNKVKGREWFRPFAGSVMQEHAKEWFDLRGMDETPFMMYAVELQDKAIGELPAVTHVDGTCRIQTVKEEQNKHYYDLINEFYKLSGVPVLFNTSFNLAGQPLVESIFDAYQTLRDSSLEYVYFPEVGKLLYLANTLDNMPTIEEEGDG